MALEEVGSGQTCGGVGVKMKAFFPLLPQHFGTSFKPPIYFNGVIYFWVDQRF